MKKLRKTLDVILYDYSQLNKYEWNIKYHRKSPIDLILEAVQQWGEECLGENDNPNLDLYKGIQNNLRAEIRERMQKTLK